MAATTSIKVVSKEYPVAKPKHDQTAAVTAESKAIRGCLNKGRLTTHGGNNQQDQNGHVCTSIDSGGLFLGQAFRQSN